MKKIFYCLTIFTLAITSINAQNFIDKHYSFLEDIENVKSVFVSAKAFDIVGNLNIQADDPDFQTMQEMVQTVNSFQLLSVPEYQDAKSEFKKAQKLANNKYEQLISLRDEGERLAVYIDEKDGIVYEIVGIACIDHENNFTVFSVDGRIDLNNVTELMSKIDFSDESPLSEARTDMMENVKVYPNPALKNGTINIEVPESLAGGKATIFDMNGKVIEIIEQLPSDSKLDVSSFSTNFVIVEISKGESSIRKKVLIIE